MTFAEQIENYAGFHAWKSEYSPTLLDLWGNYMDNPRTPGICTGFEDFCWQAFEHGVNL